MEQNPRGFIERQAQRMNNTEKALEHFKAINEADPESPLAPYRREAISALIMRIPEEPVENRCPHCSMPFMIKTSFCGNCGQAMK